MERNKMPLIRAVAKIVSNLSLEEVAEIISERVFGGLPFEGKDYEIYEEIPAIYIGPAIMGFAIILSAGEANDYFLEINQHRTLSNYINYNSIPEEWLRINTYLYHVLKHELYDVPEIQIIELNGL
ncbi:hypothetical protein A4H97_30080 [Niastella yeongjuensis]|uniref:Uncharacterized protein n=1 Tax=Niastella yeongjuensis TaxID=354355 RepID=A0A1V9EQ68_9BACT|nr:hypothetical protein [Niastella yeongjuensis]OQP48084.1 hypothetical protein A4H97_30080 [Niastella yeongjuensis]SEO26085.1 hypothetical protein SAMN05660816_02417 [Niastella yeongjuensis]